MACEVFHKGKKYTDTEFKAFLLNGGLDTFIESETVDMKAEPTEKKGPEKEKRRFTQQILADPQIPQNVKDAFTEETVYYNQLPNSVSRQTAEKLLDYLGAENAKKEVLNLNNGMPSAVRFIMAQSVLKQYRQDKEYDLFNAFLEEFAQITTDYGQGIQALSLYDESSPESNIAKAKKEIDEQRKKRFKTHKKQTNKIVKETKSINKESAKEAVKKVQGKVDKASEIPEGKRAASKEYGKENKIVTKQRYEELKKQLKGKLFSSPVPPELVEIGVYHLEAGGRKFAEFAANMVYEFGNKVKPYLKSVYNEAKSKLEGDFSTDEEIQAYEAEEKGKEIESRIEKLLKGGKGDVAKAVAEINNLPNRDSLWGKYRQYAAGRLKRLLTTEIQNDIEGRPVLKEFTDGLVKNLTQQIEGDKPSTTKATKKAIEIIADAYKNIEKYQEVWEQTQKEVQEKYKDEPEKLAELDEYFGDVLSKPFSDKLVRKSIQEELKDLNIKIEDIVVQHYTVYDRTLKTLQEKLIEKAGLDEQEAAQLATAISKEFDKIATEKKKSMLSRIFTDKQKKASNVKTLEQKIIELTNLGAFEDETILNKYAEAFGFPELTPENIQKIEQLSEKVQEATEGFQKFRAIEDLLTYQANIKGVSKWDIALSLWYASILSGPITQLKNIVSNTFNTLALYGNVIAQNPKSTAFVTKGFLRGAYQGLFEAQETLKTGYSPIRGKVEVPPALERMSFKGKFNPANMAKYVRRAMVAADVVFFEGLRELRAYQLAYKIAAEKGKDLPDHNTVSEAYKILNRDTDAIASAQEQAEFEYRDKVEEIEQSEATDKEQQKKQAERDKRRRVYEIISQSREVDFSQEAATFASKGTYNYPPDGVLGALAKTINNLASQKDMGWIRLVVPFTNIIANVANESLNYTPLGYVAAAREGGIVKQPKIEISEQEKRDQLVKATIGTLFMVSMYILSQSTGDDDEPVIQITANGTGDYRKNYELRETGWQPYSIKIGNTWYSYQYSPAMIVLSFIGNIRDAEKYRSEKLNDAFWTKTAVALTGVIRTFFDQTFLASANQGMSAIADPRNEDVVGDFTEWVKKATIGTAVPNIYTQTAKEMESWMDIPTKEVKETMVGSILKDVPVARDQYYNKINALGEPIIPKTDVFVSSVEPDKIWGLIADKKAWIGAPSIRTTTIVENGIERPMTQKEFYEFAKIRGAIIKNYLESNYEDLKNEEPEIVKKRVSKVKSSATKSAKYQIMGMEPEPEE